jgi:hypothetical protein
VVSIQEAKSHLWLVSRKCIKHLTQSSERTTLKKDVVMGPNTHMKVCKATVVPVIIN